jgi:predicted transcriptional regulator of viral defense system
MSVLTVSSRVKKRLTAIPEGKIFDISNLGVTANEDQSALVKTLSRLAKTGVIKRAARGKYFKPQITRFGTLAPDENEIIKLFLVKRNQTIGYETGLSLYNKLGLTTQIPKTIVIARNVRLKDRTQDNIKIKFVLQSIRFKSSDILVLQLLDVLKDINKIPDSSPTKAVLVIIEKLKSMEEKELKKMIKFSLEYNPRTRALLGAILDCYFKSIDVSIIADSLNPITIYKIGIRSDVLSNHLNWNII